MPTVRLHRQICAFIDVLGGALLFRGEDRVRARSFFTCLEEFERRLNNWSPHFPKKRRSTALVKTFSDNVFVAFPFGSANMSDEGVVDTFLSELNQQVYELTLLAGFPLRGGIAAGPLMFTDKFLFGPALVEAVRLEKAALFPRILVSKSVLKYVRADRLSSRLVLKDADGHVFMDYLGTEGWHLQRHRDYVLQGLYAHSAHVHERQKYEWLVQYHNHVAHRAGKPELLISVDRATAFSPLMPPLEPADLSAMLGRPF